MTFTEDWTTQFTDLWWSALSDLAGQTGIRGVEVGTFEGRSAIWFVENILTGPDSRLTIVDHDVSPLFRDNVEQCRHKIELLESDSRLCLAGLEREYYDFAYVDACGHTLCTLWDSLLCFNLLKIGGILIVDGPHAQNERSEGCDAVLMGLKHRCDVLSTKRQTMLRKTARQCLKPNWRVG